MQVNYLSESLFEKAQANFLLKKYPTTIDLINKSLENMEDHQSPLKGHLYLLMSKTYFAMLQFKDTQKVSHQALKYLLLYNRFYEAAQIYDLLGHVACQMGQYPEAVKYYQSALKILPINSHQAEQEEFKAYVHLSLGKVSQHLLDPKNQQKHFCRGLFISKRIHNIDLYAEALLGLGTYFFQKQKYEQGRKILLKALKFFNKLGDIQGIGHSLHTLGQIYTHAQEPTRAINALKLAFYLFEHLDDQIHQAKTLIHLARIYLPEDPEKGREICDQATSLLSSQTSIHSKNQSEIILGQSYLIMGLYYRYLNNPEMARYYLKESMEIFEMYHCNQEYQEALELYNTTIITPKWRPKKNNILAFKLGLSGS